MTPLVSVLTSCYNSAEFLPEAIESILRQTFKDFEFILIDDGSSDNTLDIIRSYAEKDNRIVVISKKNTGMTDSLNTGIKVGRGKWIARLDADDIALPERIEKQLKNIKMYSDTVLFGTGCIEIDQFGKIIKQHCYPMGHKSLIRRFEKGGSPFPHSSVIYNSEAVRAIGGYRNRLAGSADLDLWLRMSYVGQIRCINELLIKLRRHPGSMSVGNKTMLTLWYVAVLSYFLRKNGYPDPVEQNDKAYQTFFSWLENRLIEKDIFEIMKLWSDLRQGWYIDTKTSIFKRCLRLLKDLAKSQQGFKLLHHKIFDSSLAFKLANEWIIAN